MNFQSGQNKGRLFGRLALVGLALVLAFGLTASPAAAQSGCGQYSDCEGDVGPAGGSGEGSGSEALINVGENPTGDLGDGAGKLPFTGYPLTPLILLLLALLAAGIGLRTYAAVRERMRVRGAGPHSFG